MSKSLVKFDAVLVRLAVDWVAKGGSFSPIRDRLAWRKKLVEADVVRYWQVPVKQVLKDAEALLETLLPHIEDLPVRKHLAEVIELVDALDEWRKPAWRFW